MLAPLVLAPPLLTARPARSQPLWPGASYTEEQRRLALRRGLDFLYRTALNRRHFDDNGEDLLWCFFNIASTSADDDLKRRAWRMGQERARYWRRQNPRVLANSTAADLRGYAYGSLSCDGFEVSDS